MTNYVFKSIIGNIELSTFNQRVQSIKITRKKSTKTEDPLLLKSASQINDFLKRKRKSLSFPTQQIGTIFQNRVWKKLKEVPHGKTVSYCDLANELKSSPRAVGGACGKNRLMLVVPCHRVIAKNGKLTGFTSVGGIKAKKRLLDIEQKTI